MKRVFFWLFCSVIALGAFTGCKSETQMAAAEVLSAQANTIQTTKTASQNLGAADTAQLPIQADPDIDLEKGLHIAVVAKSTEGNYWKQMRKYMKKTVAYFNEFYELEGDDALHITFEGPDSDTNVDNQINTIDAVLAENPSALCLAAIDMNSCQAQLETAQDNGIPVILFDSGVKYSDNITLCATDNQAAGTEGAQKLCAAINQKGKVAVFANASYSQACSDRIKGFRQEIRKNHKNVEVSYLYTENQETDMETSVRDALENTQVDGIFCTSQTIAEQVLAILEKYPDKEIALIGFDAGKTQLQAIQEGREIGTIVQNIPLIASQTIQSAVYAAQPEYSDDLNKYIKADYMWVDTENLEQAEQSGLFYE